MYRNSNLFRYGMLALPLASSLKFPSQTVRTSADSGEWAAGMPGIAVTGTKVTTINAATPAADFAVAGGVVITINRADLRTPRVGVGWALITDGTATAPSGLLVGGIVGTDEAWTYYGARPATLLPPA